MDNTEKLLKAFIEASGYEIDEIVIPARISNESDLLQNAIDKATGTHKTSLLTQLNKRRFHQVVDYKVTKNHRSTFPWMDTNSPAWSAIVEYVTDHNDDIEIGINDFSMLRPVLEFFNRGS